MLPTYRSPTQPWVSSASGPRSVCRARLSHVAAIPLQELRFISDRFFVYSRRTIVSLASLVLLFTPSDEGPMNV
ncbi:hypothetical protein LY78DRAFT_301736 [Colletotrichum sublineola]|nr:hypothetical protein LY78DRAFT_301736 [Colletotrichum sublineola]